MPRDPWPGCITMSYAALSAHSAFAGRSTFSRLMHARFARSSELKEYSCKSLRSGCCNADCVALSTARALQSKGRALLTPHREQATRSKHADGVGSEAEAGRGEGGGRGGRSGGQTVLIGPGLQSQPLEGELSRQRSPAMLKRINLVLSGRRRRHSLGMRTHAPVRCALGDASLGGRAVQRSLANALVRNRRIGSGRCGTGDMRHLRLTGGAGQPST